MHHAGEVLLGGPLLAGGEALISLAKGADPAKVAGVSLVGGEGALEWSRDEAGLHVELPEKAPCDHAYALEIKLGE